MSGTRRTVTIKQTTRRTTKRTTTITATVHEDEPAKPIAWAAGWHNVPRMSDDDWYNQRDGQVERCLRFLWTWAASNKPTPERMAAVWAAGVIGNLRAAAELLEPPASLGQDAVTILRAGPAATLSELTLGRS